MTAAATTTRTRTRTVVAACMLLALLLRLPFVDVPLGVDEGGIAYIAQAWPDGHGSLYGAYWLDRPPVLVLLFKLAVLGGDEGVRALGAVAAVALVALVAGLAHQVAGDVAGRSAALVAALLSGSVALAAVYTPGELLAAVPSTASVLALVLAYRRRQARWLLAAGALAVCAALTKQSAVDAGLAGVAYLIALALSRPRVAARSLAAYVAGAAIPLAVVVGWQVSAPSGQGGLLYALLGFRVDALNALSASTLPLHVRLGHLALPALASGLAFALAATAAGLWRLRADRVLAATIAAWLAGGIVGVLAGGSYWRHYLIELVPVCSIGTALALDAIRPRRRQRVLAAATAAAVAVTIGAAVYLPSHPVRRPELAVAGYVRSHAAPGDTQYVMYARANVAFYDGLRTPFPYAWSLMLRAVPGARAQLRSLLDSPARPTWIIGWQHVDRWQVDRDGSIDRTLARNYRRVAVVCGHPILLRRDRRRSAAAPRASCGPVT
jgi:hypothetical protein